MSIFDLYGISLEEEAKFLKRISNALEESFTPHNSSYWGDYYCTAIGLPYSFRIIPNYFADEWQYEEYKAYPWILEANNIENPEAALLSLSKLVEVTFLCRHES